MAEAKNDLNRIGLFSEMGYISIGDPYVNSSRRPFNTSASKGKQMLPGGSKERSSLQAGYFDETFSRVMTGEGYSDPVKRRRQERLDKTKKNLGKAFTPSHAGKQSSGAGSHYGTFSGTIPTFSPVTQPKRPYKPPGRNFTTNPPKKGTGYGYVNVLIGAPQTYSDEQYDRAKELAKKEHLESKRLMKGAELKLNLHPRAYFDDNPYESANNGLPIYREVKKEKSNLKPFIPSAPSKQIGGSKAGCFTQYPLHSEDVYVGPKRITRGTGSGRNIFRPSQGPKNMPTNSIMAQNVERRINRSNFREAALPSISI